MNKTLVGVFIAVVMAAPAISAEPGHRKVLTSLSVDFDGDGKMDRAELVLINPESADVAFNKNQYYMVADSERVDLVLTLDAASGKPAFVKKKIVDPERAFMVTALESKGKGSLSVTSCYGCGAMKSWDETLTIAYRHGHFVVAGLSRDWEWGTHLADGNVGLVMGGCDINYLTGKGVVSEGLSDGKSLRMRFKKIKLADWSDAKQPKACQFY